MPKVQIKKAEKSLPEEELKKLTKEELISRVLSLEAHNTQLKNILAKTQHSSVKSNQRPFDFTKCHFRHVLLHIYYLGWDYKGFATQEDSTNTIEYHLFNALTRTCLIKDRNSSNYHRCGRTDKGVSSYGQVISLSLRSKLSEDCLTETHNEIDYCGILNRVLPDNIQCVAWAPIEENFSARFDCKSRTYKYYFPKGSLNIEQMRIASKLLLGTHDFRNFCKMDVGNGVVEFTRNILDVQINTCTDNDSLDEYSMYNVTIKAKAFLWHQIRCIMTILFLIGQNKEKPEIITELLDITSNPKKPEYHLASEMPLNLFYCDYNSINWCINESSLRIVINKLKLEWTTVAIKRSMIREMIKSLENRLEGNSESEMNEDCLVNNLMTGSKMKTYIPVMKRQRCGGIDEKIEHFLKRNRLEIIEDD